MLETEILPQSKRIRGVLAPVVTPFKADLSPDPRPIHQALPMVTFTELRAGSVRHQQRSELDGNRRANGVARCVGRGRHRSDAHHAGYRLLLNHRDSRAHSACDKTRLRRCADAAAVFYKNVSEEGLYRYFSEVVQRVGDTGLKIYLYHIPSVAIVGITPKLVERLLKSYPTAIAGMKDSSGDWNNTKTFLDAFAVRAARAARTFDVFVGSESFLLANMRNGGAGTISATANVNPAAIHELYRKCSGAMPRESKTLGKRSTDLERSSCVWISSATCSVTGNFHP